MGSMGMCDFQYLWLVRRNMSVKVCHRATYVIEKETFIAFKMQLPYSIPWRETKVISFFVNSGQGKSLS